MFITLTLPTEHFDSRSDWIELCVLTTGRLTSSWFKRLHSAISATAECGYRYSTRQTKFRMEVRQNFCSSRQENGVARHTQQVIGGSRLCYLSLHGLQTHYITLHYITQSALVSTTWAAWRFHGGPCSLPEQCSSCYLNACGMFYRQQSCSYNYSATSFSKFLYSLNRPQWPRGFGLLEIWDRGLEFCSKHGCTFAFLCVAPSCESRGLAMGRSPIQGVLQKCL